MVYYEECERPRVIYSKNKLNHNQRMLLAKSISSFEYPCGTFLFPSDTKSKRAGTLCIHPRSNVQCKLKFLIMDWILEELINAAILQVVPWQRKGDFYTETIWKGGKVIFFICKCNFTNDYVTPNYFYILHSF